MSAEQAQTGTRPGGAEFATILAATRDLLDAVHAADAPDTVVREAAELTRRAAALLQPYATDERRRPAGNRPDLPGRGNPQFPPFEVDVLGTDLTTGRVTLREVHLGGGAAVHGGVPPLLFDEILGRLVAHGRPKSRTAYLRVDYRALTPLGVELQFRAWVQRIEGRKVFAAGQLSDGATVLAEAEGLFVLLRPDQR